MTGVLYGDSHRIIQNGCSMREFDAVIPDICCRFSYVSDESHLIICILYVYVKPLNSVRSEAQGVRGTSKKT